MVKFESITVVWSISPKDVEVDANSPYHTFPFGPIASAVTVPPDGNRKPVWAPPAPISTSPPTPTVGKSPGDKNSAPPHSVPPASTTILSSPCQPPVSGTSTALAVADICAAALFAPSEIHTLSSGARAMFVGSETAGGAANVWIGKGLQRSRQARQSDGTDEVVLAIADQFAKERLTAIGGIRDAQRSRNECEAAIPIDGGVLAETRRNRRSTVRRNGPDLIVPRIRDDQFVVVRIECYALDGTEPNGWSGTGDVSNCATRWIGVCDVGRTNLRSLAGRRRSGSPA